jgi:tetratricopeptide (TPR) repeat protein
MIEPRKCLLILLASFIIIIPAFSQQPPKEDSPSQEDDALKNDARHQLQKTKEWSEAAEHHVAGTADAAATQIAAWKLDELKKNLDFIESITSQAPKSRKRTLAKPRYQAALSLTDDEVQSGDLNRLIKKATLLHTDIALLGLEKRSYLELRERMAFVIDGRVIFYPKPMHWEIARRLIELTPSSPGNDKAVRQWLVSTIARLQQQRFLPYAQRNLDLALKKFPSDERLLFYEGALHEMMASPLITNSPFPQGTKPPSREAELKIAQEFLAKALKISPGFGEAHLRLGRVLAQLGRHNEAIAQLSNAAESLKDPQLLYYAELYLGSELAISQQKKEALDHYERAASICPKAVAPLLGMSFLARSNNDTGGALNAVTRMLALRADASEPNDPWWAYDIAHVRDADALIAEMYSAYQGTKQ